MHICERYLPVGLYLSACRNSVSEVILFLQQDTLGIFNLKDASLPFFLLCGILRFCKMEAV